MLALRRFILNRRSLRSCTIPVIVGAVLIILGLFQLVSHRDNVLMHNLRSNNVNSSNNERLDNVDRDALMEAFGSPDMDPINSIPVSPLESVPLYDNFMDIKRNSSWLINRRSHYKHFNELSLEDRCKFYFRTLYTLDNDWSNSVHKLMYSINDDEEVDDVKGADGNPMDEESEKLYRRRNDMFLGFERIRAYDKCFMQGNPVNIQEIFPESDKVQKEKIQSKLIEALNVTLLKVRITIRTMTNLNSSTRCFLL